MATCLGLVIKELIEAGVLFSAKTLGPQTINSLDTLSKDMINDFVCLQQEQVTIMTQGQWNFNVIKQWMTATNDAMGFEARGSSVYSSMNQSGPTFAIDGEVSKKNHLLFHSELKMHPWLEVKFPFPVLISCVTNINCKDSC